MESGAFATKNQSYDDWDMGIWMEFGWDMGYVEHEKVDCNQYGSMQLSKDYFVEQMKWLLVLELKGMLRSNIGI